ncbi:hypothetical protein ONR49_25435, partial [Salmonella enterica subsp. enterica serovar Virginia]|nr:hypothetical protein [Salmonella enterica subsp. enterica serovar Virginia]
MTGNTSGTFPLKGNQALMDIDETRLEESHIVVRKLMDSAGASGRITCHTNQKAALQD